LPAYTHLLSSHVPSPNTLQAHQESKIYLQTNPPPNPLVSGFMPIPQTRPQTPITLQAHQISTIHQANPPTSKPTRVRFHTHPTNPPPNTLQANQSSTIHHANPPTSKLTRVRVNAHKSASKHTPSPSDFHDLSRQPTHLQTHSCQGTCPFQVLLRLPQPQPQRSLLGFQAAVRRVQLCAGAVHVSANKHSSHFKSDDIRSLAVTLFD